MDVDGTLTNGAITLSSDGCDTKTFCAKDGAAIKLLRALDVLPAIVSGRASPVTERRAEELGITEVHQAVGDKARVLLDLASRHGIPMEATAFVGDDLTDIPAMRVAGFAACPADAVTEVKDVVDFVADRPGGDGAVREIVEALLTAEGRWDALVEAASRIPEEQTS